MLLSSFQWMMTHLMQNTTKSILRVAFIAISSRNRLHINNHVPNTHQHKPTIPHLLQAANLQNGVRIVAKRFWK